ncbi:MAG: hypothetical protein HYS58_01055 [Elusimicrobia bacterium]|nr:hypothetical protein [Elusimicrobiota bacterium]
MFKRISFLFLVFFALTVKTVSAENQFLSFGIQQAGKLLANPPLFMYEFQRNMESTNPLPPGKWIGASYHFLGGILIVPLPDLTSAGNISGKLRLHAEGRMVPGLPQLDVVGGYWSSLLTDMVVDKNATAADSDTKVTDASLKGSYYGVVMTSSLEPRVRLFWSYKFSKLDMKLDLNKEQDILGSKVKSFNGGMTEHTLSAGLEHAYAKNRKWIIQGGYGMTNNLITTKVSWYMKYVEFGLSIYPESVFIMQPQLNFHLNF